MLQCPTKDVCMPASTIDAFTAVINLSDATSKLFQRAKLPELCENMREQRAQEHIVGRPDGSALHQLI